MAVGDGRKDVWSKTKYDFSVNLSIKIFYRFIISYRDGEFKL